MNLLSKLAASFDRFFSRLLASHIFTILHITFITIWLILDLELTVLALVLSLEGVIIWTIVLKSTHKIQDVQEKKDRFENKRFREFLEDDIQVTSQNLKMTKEVFKKLEEIDFKLVEMAEMIDREEKSLNLSLSAEAAKNPAEGDKLKRSETGAA